MGTDKINAAYSYGAGHDDRDRRGADRRAGQRVRDRRLHRLREAGGRGRAASTSTSTAATTTRTSARRRPTTPTSTCSRATRSSTAPTRSSYVRYRHTDSDYVAHRAPAAVPVRAQAPDQAARQPHQHHQLPQDLRREHRDEHHQRAAVPVAARAGPDRAQGPHRARLDPGALATWSTAPRSRSRPRREIATKVARVEGPGVRAGADGGRSPSTRRRWT